MHTEDRTGEVLGIISYALGLARIAIMLHTVLPAQHISTPKHPLFFWICMDLDDRCQSQVTLLFTAAQRNAGMWQELHLDVVREKENSHDRTSWEQRG